MRDKEIIDRGVYRFRITYRMDDDSITVDYRDLIIDDESELQEAMTGIRNSLRTVAVKNSLTITYVKIKKMYKTLKLPEFNGFDDTEDY